MMHTCGWAGGYVGVGKTGFDAEVFERFDLPLFMNNKQLLALRCSIATVAVV